MHPCIARVLLLLMSLYCYEHRVVFSWEPDEHLNMCAVYLRESYIYDGMGTRVLSLATLTCPECAGKSSSFTLPFVANSG